MSKCKFVKWLYLKYLANNLTILSIPLTFLIVKKLVLNYFLKDYWNLFNYVLWFMTIVYDSHF